MANIRGSTIVRILVYTPVAVALLSAIYLCSSVFLGFNIASEFTDVPGPQAVKRLANWPDDVRVNDVKTISYKCESSIDSYSAWYCIHLKPEAAETWAASIHNERTVWGADCLDGLDSGYEGVHRQVSGPPFPRRTTGHPPTWWLPPHITFRATEVMLWYKSHRSGVASATYTAFDQSTRTLWIYDYSCQHDTLWDRGELPPGETFSGDHEV